jgi:hypothetical protein
MDGHTLLARVLLWTLVGLVAFVGFQVALGAVTTWSLIVGVALLLAAGAGVVRLRRSRPTAS